MHKTHSHPIPVPMSVMTTRRTGCSSNSPLNAEFVEFETWLEMALDDFGADGQLYARCVFSILRQTIDDTSTGHIASPDPHLDSATVIKSVGRDAVLTFPSMMLASGGGADPMGPASTGSAIEGCRRALLECLRTIDSDERRLHQLADEILSRYKKAVHLCHSEPGSQNESIDSGVCPSPVESEQNYDEAFPRLFDVDNDVVDVGDQHQQANVPITTYCQRSSAAVLRTAGKQHRQKQQQQSLECTVANTTITTTTDPIAIPSAADGATAKVLLSSIAASDATITSATFTTSNQSSFTTTNAAIVVAAAHPSRTVTAAVAVPPHPAAVHYSSPLSTSLRSSSIGNKLSAPFTREWATRSVDLVDVCNQLAMQHHHVSSTVIVNQQQQQLPPHRSRHSSTHLPTPVGHPHFVVAKAPTNTSGGTKVIACPSKLEYNYCGHSSGSAVMAVAAAAAAGGTAGSYEGNNNGCSALLSASLPVANSLRSSTTSSPSICSGGASSFDTVPRFILHHVINERNRPIRQTAPRRTSESQLATIYNEPISAGRGAVVPSTMPASFVDPWCDANLPFAADINKSMLMMDDGGCGNIGSYNKHLMGIFENDDVELPPTVDVANVGLQDFFCVPRMKDLNDCQLPLPESLPAAPTFIDSVLETDAGVKIPVNPETHFVPIRSESMENAYLPQCDQNDVNGNGSSSYAVDFYGAERYFVLRNDAILPEPQRRKHSLSLKFKADLPTKQCQTTNDPNTTMISTDTSKALDEAKIWINQPNYTHVDEYRWCDDGDVLNNKNDVDVVLDTTNDVNDDSGFESATGGGCFVHDGDNSVALTDAWANIVWEPRRLSNKSSCVTLKTDSTDPDFLSNMTDGGGVNDDDQRWPSESTSALHQSHNDHDSSSSSFHPTVEHQPTTLAQQQFDSNYASPIIDVAGCKMDEDEDDDDLLRFVSNINLLSPLSKTAAVV